MPPVFGPVSPSPARLWSCAVPIGRTSVPSQSTKNDASSPLMTSSITTSAPAPPKAPPNMSSMAASASATVSATITPLPAASPSALTTMGAPCARTWSFAGPAAVNRAQAAVGAPAASQIALVKCFEASSSAAACEGPNTKRPASRSRSLTPAASGASGPMMINSIALPSQKLTTAAPFSISRLAHSAICAMPALPGATISLSHLGFCITAQAMLCSRPPPPRIRIFMPPLSCLALPDRRSKVGRRQTQGAGMSDLIDDPIEGENAPEFSVSEISGAVKRVVEGEFAHVRVKGEVGRVSRPRSGHVYMDLKDDRAVLAGVIWKGVAARLSVQPEEGMEVVATGRLTTFPGQSRYQIVIEDLKPAGMGALMAMLEKRKAQLASEGLFAPERKKKLPYLPEVIGVVTSPSGAVIRDILHRLRDRFPRKVLIWPVAVQGEKCAPEVTRAIEGFNRLTPGGALPRPDLLIVARGGGSIEDLWGFNEEIVARAAAESDIPLISAVGHETDTTLIDFVSDQRAPTPTAAAEIAVPVRLELLGWVGDQQARMVRAVSQRMQTRDQRLRDLARALPRADALMAGPTQRLDLMADLLPRALTRSVDLRRGRLIEAAASLRPSLLSRGLAEQQRRYDQTGSRLAPGLSRVVDTKREALARRADRLNVSQINRDLATRRERFEALARRLSGAGQAQVRDWRTRLDAMERLRETLGYKETLKRGYAVVRGDDAVVTRKETAATASVLEIEFADGRLKLGAAAATGARPAAKPKPKPPEQGSLF